jgi:20S proteasome alpha/beta subunit
MELDSHKLLAGSGVAADTSAFSEYVQKNLKLYELNNDVKLNSHGAANFIRGEVSLLYNIDFNSFSFSFWCSWRQH